MKPILVTTGEPAGIGPDISLALAKTDLPVVLMGDIKVLKARANALNLDVQFELYSDTVTPQYKKNVLFVTSLSCDDEVMPGHLNKNNASYVMSMLTSATNDVRAKKFAALVTAPVHKGIINDAGIKFSGHTELLAELCGVKQVIMMLACQEMKVALATTHIPLSDVAKTITPSLLSDVFNIVQKALINDFGIVNPCMRVAGLNPHAGEGGYLGREEIDVITPAIKLAKNNCYNISGPYPADTLFTKTYLINTDVFIAMYHDQGLPVIKYADFEHAVNITLGLPIIRTSVDHGTALSLAATGQASAESLIKAIEMAMMMASQGEKNHD